MVSFPIIIATGYTASVERNHNGSTDLVPRGRPDSGSGFFSGDFEWHRRRPMRGYVIQYWMCEIGWVQLDLPKKLLSTEKVHVPSPFPNFFFFPSTVELQHLQPVISFRSLQFTMSEKQYIKNRRVDDLATAPTPQNTPATASTLPTPASQAPTIPTIKEEDGTILKSCFRWSFATCCCVVLCMHFVLFRFPVAELFSFFLHLFGVTC